MQRHEAHRDSVTQNAGLNDADRTIALDDHSTLFSLVNPAPASPLKGHRHGNDPAFARCRQPCPLRKISKKIK